MFEGWSNQTKETKKQSSTVDASKVLDDHYIILCKIKKCKSSD